MTVMRRVISRTPYRISLFGGGSDYPKWYREHGGSVLATTINHYCYISVRNMPPWFPERYRIVYSKIEDVTALDKIQHPAVRGVLCWLLDHSMLDVSHDDGYEIGHEGDLPSRSGLGSSSTFTVGLINALVAFHGETLKKNELAKVAIQIEQEIIMENVGSQDQVLAAYGGFNRIDFLENDAIRVIPAAATRETLDLLQSRLLLVFTGLARTASEVAGLTIASLDKKLEDMQWIQASAAWAEKLLNEGDLDNFATLLDEAWQRKRKLAEGITNPYIDRLYTIGKLNGAVGGKLLGAGAGGFMVFYHHDVAELSKRLNKQGFYITVPVQFENRGSHIVKHVPKEA